MNTCVVYAIIYGGILDICVRSDGQLVYTSSYCLTWWVVTAIAVVLADRSYCTYIRRRQHNAFTLAAAAAAADVQALDHVACKNR